MEESFLEQPEILQHLQPMSIDTYHKLCELDASFVATELLQGLVVKKMTKSTEHSFYSNLFFQLLQSYKPTGTVVLKENPLTIGKSESEPDLAVVSGDIFTYREENPKTALLVVEIAKTSVILDRLKAKIYASAGIPEYWIAHTRKKQIEVYSQPVGNKYQSKNVYQESDGVSIFGKSISLRNDLEIAS
ncbi:MAG: Uma2 family endonuclease [Spirochaetota bacterium]